MGWIDDLRGHVVGLDTTPVIYYIERKKPYIDMLRPFFQAVDNGDITLVTSIVTLLEVLVHPFRYGDTELVSKYRETLFNTDGLLTVHSHRKSLKKLHDYERRIRFGHLMLSRWRQQSMPGRLSF